MTNKDKKYVPLFGTVSHDGGLYTLHFQKTESEAAINRQGYNPKVFKGLSIPIIRFDKSELDNVLECIEGEVAEIEEYYQVRYSPWSKPISLANYLEHIKSKGVPVETGYH